MSKIGDKLNKIIGEGTRRWATAQILKALRRKRSIK